MTPGLTFDAGGLIALERNDRRVVALLARNQKLGGRVTVPASALAQVVRQLGRQARIFRLVRMDTVDVIAMDRSDAVKVGRLLAASGTSDVVDAHVVLCARRRGQRAVTSDGADLRQLDPTVELVEV